VLLFKRFRFKEAADAGVPKLNALSPVLYPHFGRDIYRLHH
jgi:hypothetical protein